MKPLFRNLVILIMVTLLLIWAFIILYLLRHESIYHTALGGWMVLRGLEIIVRADANRSRDRYVGGVHAALGAMISIYGCVGLVVRHSK